MILGFRVWYADGSTVEGTTFEEWKAAPDDDVLVIVVYKDTGRTLYSGGDWYKWHPFTDDGMSYVSSGEWGTEKPKPDGCQDCIKHGVGVSDEQFKAVYAEALGSSWP